MKEQDLAVLADLEHSLRSPIAQAYRRAKHLLRDGLNADDAEAQTRAIMGLCGRARQVLRNIDLIVKLHRKTPLAIEVLRISPDDIRRSLDDAIEDSLAMLPESRRNQVKMDARDLEILHTRTVLADLDLLEQAFRSVLDNAFKYSFAGKPIEIEAKLASSGAFTISFTSCGLNITQADVAHVAEYGWRGRQAMMTTGSGSGIGLWLTDNIMKAQRGALLVGATDESNETRVTLLLPTE